MFASATAERVTRQVPCTWRSIFGYGSLVDGAGTASGDRRRAPPHVGRGHGQRRRSPRLQALRGARDGRPAGADGRLPRPRARRPAEVNGAVFETDDLVRPRRARAQLRAGRVETSEGPAWTYIGSPAGRERLRRGVAEDRVVVPARLPHARAARASPRSAPTGWTGSRRRPVRSPGRYATSCSCRTSPSPLSSARRPSCSIDPPGRRVAAAVPAGRPGAPRRADHELGADDGREGRRRPDHRSPTPAASTTARRPGRGRRRRCARRS